MTNEGSDEGDRAIRILVADDSQLICRQACNILNQQDDMRAEPCSDPAQALATVARFRPDVILQDVYMGDASGLDLLREYKNRPDTAKAAVIMFSGDEDSALREAAVAAGACDYLLKSDAAQALVPMVRKHAPA